VEYKVSCQHVLAVTTPTIPNLIEVIAVTWTVKDVIFIINILQLLIQPIKVLSEKPEEKTYRYPQNNHPMY